MTIYQFHLQVQFRDRQMMDDTFWNLTRLKHPLKAYPLLERDKHNNTLSIRFWKKPYVHTINQCINY